MSNNEITDDGGRHFPSYLTSLDWGNSNIMDAGVCHLPHSLTYLKSPRSNIIGWFLIF
jgi:hypothetical protein